MFPDRLRYDRVIHLFGDSIMRGFAAGQWADEMVSTHPLHRLSSPSRVANSVFADNGLKGWYMRYAGSLGVAAIESLLAEGSIRSGDVVVLEDAGYHWADPDAYEESWIKFRSAVVTGGDVTCLMMTMFDYITNFRIYGPQYQYDIPVSPGGRTMNDATRSAALARIPGAIGQTRLIEMRALMDAWRDWAWNADGVRVMLNDGIHPNVWGQAMFVGTMLRHVGLRPYISQVPTAESIAIANWQTLGYGTSHPSWTPNRAAAYMQRCLIWG